MIVEIHGHSFQNLGAHLMLRTVQHRLTRDIHGLEFASDPSAGPYQDRARANLLQLFPQRGHITTDSFIKRLRWQRIAANPTARVRAHMRDYGVVTLGDVAGLVDISGLSFSDHFEIRRMIHFEALANQYVRSGKPVILMPQAFGPFGSAASREAFRRLLAACTLVYARDRHSFDICSDIGGDLTKVYLAPDITISHALIGEQPDGENGIHPYVCIVPNVKIVESGTSDAEEYCVRLAAFGRRAASRSIAVRVLVHDVTGHDAQLAQRIVSDLGETNAIVVRERNPDAMKRLLGGSLATVGSRYHALVSALSQCVPSIAIGWSHKYQGLMSDFEVPELAVSLGVSCDEALEAFTALLDQCENDRVRTRLRASTARLASDNDRMWETVTRMIQGHISTGSSA